MGEEQWVFEYILEGVCFLLYGFIFWDLEYMQNEKQIFILSFQDLLEGSDRF